jgi:hypothetical protein
MVPWWWTSANQQILVCLYREPGLVCTHGRACWLVPVGQGVKQRGGGAGPKEGGVRTGRAPGGGRTGRTGANSLRVGNSCLGARLGA